MSETTRTTAHWMRHSPVAKLLGIVFLILILLIPNAMVVSLINERSYLSTQANDQVAGTWGLKQSVKGPILAIPYYVADPTTKVLTEQMAYILPSALDIKATTSEQLKKRGIYKSILYQCGATLSGHFETNLSPDLQGKNLDWSRAKIVIGISDLTGISQEIKGKIGQIDLAFQSGTGVPILQGGVSASAANIAASTHYDFAINLDLKGSSYLGFEPVGKSTHISLSSKWPSPNFQGKFATDTNSISSKGFAATWNVLDVNRSYPQQWAGPQYNLDNEVGVELIQTVSDYSRNQRTAKYSILVIGLTFLFYFFGDIIKRLKMHPLHYLLVGMALSLFYVLLLSISEHLGFNAAYMIAAVGTIGMIVLYTNAITQNRAFAVQLLGMLVVIFGFIYTILQLEDFALLAGSLGLFIALAVIMFYTRNVSWTQTEEVVEP
jgi:inner membrane protein